MRRNIKHISIVEIYYTILYQYAPKLVRSSDARKVWKTYSQEELRRCKSSVFCRNLDGILNRKRTLDCNTEKLWTSVQRRQWHPTPVLLPGESHGRRSLEGCSPWGRWGSDMTERLHFHFSLSCIGEGNGNPLQCSCLENPRDGGAWWAAVYRVAQSRTRLKWLSRWTSVNNNVSILVY